MIKLFYHSWLRKLHQLVFFGDDNKGYTNLEMSSLENIFLVEGLKHNLRLLVNSVIRVFW